MTPTAGKLEWVRRLSILLVVAASGCGGSTVATTTSSAAPQSPAATSTTVAATTTPTAASTTTTTPTTAPISEGTTTTDSSIPVGPAPGVIEQGVSISGGRWYFDGEVTNPGSVAEGLLVNLRAVQGVFDDENPLTRDNWAYPSGPGSGVWTDESVERNVMEFISAMGEWAKAGLDAFTLSLQGGNPNPDGGGPTTASRVERVSAFDADGTLKSKWADRLVRVLDEADRLGMVVILNLFYKHQSDELANEEAVLRATENVLDLLWGANDYRNVIFDVANEVSVRASGPPQAYAHDVLTIARIHEVLRHMQEYAAARYPGHRLLVSSSIAASRAPAAVPDSYFDYAGFVLWHGNGIDMETQSRYMTTIRLRTSKPVVWNEDNYGEHGRCPRLTSSAVAVKGSATISQAVSWGFHWKGCRDYVLGYQAMPVNWSDRDSDPAKDAFLDWVAAVTG